MQPPGVPVIVGAFIFGIGMQLGGGCASGTLFSAGGGSTRMLVTLAAFIAGSVIATAHPPFWSAAPAFPPRHSSRRYGPVGALALSLALFGADLSSPHVDASSGGSIGALRRELPLAGAAPRAGCADRGRSSPAPSASRW